MPAGPLRLLQLPQQETVPSALYQGRGSGETGTAKHTARRSLRSGGRERACPSCRVRQAEPDAIIQRLYEDSVMGRLSGDRVTGLTAAYEKERAEPERTVHELRDAVSAAERETVNVQRAF